MKELLVNIIKHELKDIQTKESGDHYLMKFVDLGFPASTPLEQNEMTGRIHDSLSNPIKCKREANNLHGFTPGISEKDIDVLNDQCDVYALELREMMRLLFQYDPRYCGVPFGSVDFDVHDLVNNVNEKAMLAHLYFIYHSWSDSKSDKIKTVVIPMEQACIRALQGA